MEGNFIAAILGLIILLIVYVKIRNVFWYSVVHSAFSLEEYSRTAHLFERNGIPYKVKAHQQKHLPHGGIPSVESGEHLTQYDFLVKKNYVELARKVLDGTGLDR
ncbi:hypothetical protein [Virgibacillus senegalensis]|uniref:hypothetical protein n=1 Tax=Virgibacillus senegalensis TaxID=1499679 RepID=UPI00069D7AB1|nr:hypothetical protein [Virgibacillus senegalensis]